MKVKVTVSRVIDLESGDIELLKNASPAEACNTILFREEGNIEIAVESMEEEFEVGAKPEAKPKPRKKRKKKKVK